jgi:two-component system phosphate regulon response regulator PhoB
MVASNGQRGIEVSTSDHSEGRGHILVVDDDPDVRRTVVRLLELEGFRAIEAASGPEAGLALARADVDLVLLDVILDEEDGFDILADIRRSSDVPVIVLSARTTEMDRVMGLRLGADDYVAKPFSGPELVARITSVLRRTNPRGPADASLQFNGLAIDMRSREVTVYQKVVDTTLKEFDLLAFLAAAPRQVFSREQILDQVWGSSSAWQDDGTVTEHVRRIRQKLEGAGIGKEYITTIRGVGYRFEP